MTSSSFPPLWQILFIAIGIVSTIALVLNLFILSSPAKKDLKFEEIASGTDGTLIATLSHLANSPIQTGGTIEIVNNGDEFYPALYPDIEHAKKSINFSAYIWKPGVVSDELFALLTKKAQEGVTVRVILDGFGGKTAPQKDIEAFRAAGGHLEVFHPLRFGKFTKFHKRNHARSIIIDGTVGYTGGMAVADYWTGNAQDKDHWRDMMFRMQGPALVHLTSSFAAQWEVVSGEILAPVEIEKSKSIGNMRSISLTSFSPDEDTQQLSTFFAVSIASATQSVLIATPYMILEEQVRKALAAAAERGVEVRILVPGKIIDSKIVQSASQHYYQDLLEHGVKIYEYNPTMLHSKALVIDGTWSIIGSANIDTRSSFYNVENIIGIEDKEFAQRLTTTLGRDLSHATLITLESWKKRSIMRKMLEPISFIFDKQL